MQVTLFRALGVLRAVTALNMAILFAMRSHAYDHPMWGWGVIVFVMAWSALVTWLCIRDDPAWWVMVADLAVALAGIAVTPWVKGSQQATLVGFWVSTVVLAWAVKWHIKGGLFAASVIAAADFLFRSGNYEYKHWGNIFLLLVGGLTVGFLARVLGEVLAQRDEANARAVAAAERQRLARVVHDGVLQVLALVQRSGAELSGERGDNWSRLAELAGEQEIKLRSLVQEGSAAHSPSKVDLGSRLAALATSRVTVARPSLPVLLSEYVAGEVVAVVNECLTNVRMHAGPSAQAWVLLEIAEGDWIISVRDDGCGIAQNRLEEAAAQGRLGVRESIRGRMHDLGARVDLDTDPQTGTAWEFRGALATE